MHDPQDLKLNERSQTQKVTCCMIPFIGNVQTRQIHRDRKQIDGCPRLEVEKLGVPAERVWGFCEGDAKVLELDRSGGLTTGGIY